MTFLPLTRRPAGLQAFKVVIPTERAQAKSDPQVHDGYEWLYVLSGQLRLVLGEHDLVLQAGEAASSTPAFLTCSTAPPPNASSS